MGWELSEVRWKVSTMALWIRFIKIPENQGVAREILNRDVTVKGAWASEEQDIFLEIGGPDLFQNVNTINIF